MDCRLVSTVDWYWLLIGNNCSFVSTVDWYRLLIGIDCWLVSTLDWYRLLIGNNWSLVSTVDRYQPVLAQCFPPFIFFLAKWYLTSPLSLSQCWLVLTVDTTGITFSLSVVFHGKRYLILSKSRSRSRHLDLSWYRLLLCPCLIFPFFCIQIFLSKTWESKLEKVENFKHFDQSLGERKKWKWKWMERKREIEKYRKRERYKG